MLGGFDVVFVFHSKHAVSEVSLYGLCSCWDRFEVMFFLPFILHSHTIMLHRLGYGTGDGVLLGPVVEGR